MRFFECPPDVLELVISFLPVADIFRLRTVCKQWNELITIRAFKENGQLKFKKLELLAVWKVESDSNSLEFKAYDVEAEKWHSFDLSFLPRAGRCRVLDFAGCLACVTQKKDMDWVLYICNPLTKKWAQLPSSPTSVNFCYPGVTVKTYYCKKTGHYKVFVVSGLSVNIRHSWLFNRLVVEEFDSSSWTWAVHSQTCNPFIWWEMTGVSVLPCNNGNSASLFILLYKKISHNRHRSQLFALLFDEDKGGLGFVKIRAALPSHLLNPTMVCCERSPNPMIVALVGDRNRATGVEIWELGNKLTQWSNLATMPYNLFTDFERLHNKGLDERNQLGGWRLFPYLPGPPPPIITGGLPMIMVAGAYKHLIYIHPESMASLILAYDALTQSWVWHSTKLPQEIDAIQSSKRFTSLSCVWECAFEPSLGKVVSAHGPN